MQWKRSGMVNGLRTNQEQYSTYGHLGLPTHEIFDQVLFLMRSTVTITIVITILLMRLYIEAVPLLKSSSVPPIWMVTMT